MKTFDKVPTQQFWEATVPNSLREARPRLDDLGQVGVRLDALVQQFFSPFRRVSRRVIQSASASAWRGDT